MRRFAQTGQKPAMTFGIVGFAAVSMDMWRSCQRGVANTCRNAEVRGSQ
jgi:hypothetical protein